MKKRRDTKFLDKVILRIRHLRTEKNISQRHFQEDTGINIGRIEQGLRDFNMTTFYEICKHLDTNPEEFFSKGF